MRTYRLLPLFVLLSCLGALVARAQTQFEVLVLASPTKYHHDFLATARPSFERLSKEHNFGLTWAWDPAPFDGDLKSYAAILFLSTPPDALTDAQRANLQAYVRGGGNVVVVHAAIIDKKAWDWYEKLVGRRFRIHPIIQTGVISVVDRKFPATFPVPDKWIWSDEWYEFEAPLVTDLHDVLTVDERSYDPTRIWPGQSCSGMGNPHPVAWYHSYDGGRVFVSALGHLPEHYADKTYLDHLYGGLYWAATGRGVQE